MLSHKICLTQVESLPWRASGPAPAPSNAQCVFNDRGPHLDGSLSLSHSINVNKKIINYSESIYVNKNIDFDISRWSIGLKYHF